MDALVGRTVTKRQRDLVELWSGVGARGKNGYHSEYYAIRELMQDFSLLPGIADDVGDVVAVSLGRATARNTASASISMCSSTGTITAESETALLLKDALRAVMASLVPGIPNCRLPCSACLRAQQ